MRLIGDIADRRINYKDVFILIRHGVDIAVLDRDLNQPLTEETKPDIRVLGKQLIRCCGSFGVEGVCLRHSNRLRAMQTTTIIAEELIAAGLHVEMIESPGIKEIYQGKFVICGHVHNTEYKPLVDAWDAWQVKLDACELQYRFGDPIRLSENEYEFPKLAGQFSEFGENQGEFSLRLYQMLYDMLASDSNQLQIIVGHQASCSRIQRIISSASQLSNENEFSSGEFVRFIEKQGSRHTIDHACGIVVERSQQKIILAVLHKEINFLCKFFS